MEWWSIGVLRQVRTAPALRVGDKFDMSVRDKDFGRAERGTIDLRP